MNKFKHTIPITAIIENNGKFLFIKRSRFAKNMAGKWVFPGGKVEKGEDVIQALYRELHEETHLELDNKIAFLSSYRFFRNEDDSSSVGLVFLVQSLNKDAKFDNSIETYKWIEPEEIADYIYSYKEITDFDNETNITIPGMEVHVRNAIIALKCNLLLDKNLFSVTEYQNRRCNMDKKYFLDLINSNNIDEFISLNCFPNEEELA